MTTVSSSGVRLSTSAGRLTNLPELHPSLEWSQLSTQGWLGHPCVASLTTNRHYPSAENPCAMCLCGQPESR